MANIRLQLQYDGTRYRGFSRPEKDGYRKTISFRIHTVLERITGETVTIFAGAKTEPGVHALDQCISFHTGSSLSPDDFRDLLNRFLPQDIRITGASAEQERFRADLSARLCTYEYRICTAPVSDIFTQAYSVHIYPEPDVEAMKAAAHVLTGRHDFRYFSGVRGKKNTFKTIESISFHRSDGEIPTLTITLTASDFLYQMPSRIIATLLQAGAGLKSPGEILSILEGREAAGAQKAGALCDPRGLLLKKITY